jgi:hypothetical protein
MGTIIHGVAASENIDSSGERISISGLDCSSFDRGEGVANWEHKSDHPAQTVGRVISYKKIFEEKDCDTDEQRKFWHKVNCPYLYVIIELMDDYKDSAKEVAGEIKYNAANAGKFKHSTLNFSIEGAKIEKKGIEVTRSIARKVTLTNMFCNKAAEAELLEKKGKKKDSLDSIFKSEIEIELYNSSDKARLWDLLKKTDDSHEHSKALGLQPMKKEATALGDAGAPTSAGGLLASEKMAEPHHNKGHVLGRTKSGKDVFSSDKIEDLKHYTVDDHKDAHALHDKVSKSSKDPLQAQDHSARAIEHLRHAGEKEHKAKQMPQVMAQRRQQVAQAQKEEREEKMEAMQEGNNMKKALEAGSGLAAPSTLVGGSALAKENVEKKMKKNEPMKKGLPQGWKGSHGRAKTGQLFVHTAHPEHGKVSTSFNQSTGHYETKHNGTITGLKGKKGIHASAGEAMAHHQAYIHAVHANTVAPKRPMNIASSSLLSTRRKTLLGKAEDEYQRWEKREQYQAFMAKRMPHLTKGEIDAIGRVLALKKSHEAEKALEKMVQSSFMPKAEEKDKK